MLGELKPHDVEDLLTRANVGRIGCYAAGRVYVVPVSYAYDGESIYAHSADGLKIRSMRAFPRVCFQVDHFVNLANWSSVIAWGTYEELGGALEERASSLLVSRLGPLRAIATAMRDTRVHGVALEASRMTAFRIRLKEKTGRFER